MILTENVSVRADRPAILEPGITFGVDARMIPLADIVRSPYNTRRIFEEKALAELAQSIKANGIVQPLIVRPNPAIIDRKGDKSVPYELVAGERRFRAANLAGLTVVPCIIRELTHEETLDQQLLENVQRQDLHPLEEAAGFEQRRQAGATMEQIAEKVGCDRSHVSRRLQLLKLIPEAQTVFLEGRMIPKHALQIARLPETEQPKAFCYLMTDNWVLATRVQPGERLRLKGTSDKTWTAKATVSPAELGRFIEDAIFRSLAKAPWSKKDAELVPAAGACNTCTKRTGGANALLFDESAAKHEQCLDGECYEKKFQAHLVQLQAKGGEKLKLLADNDEWQTWKEVHGEECPNEVKALLADGRRRGQKIRACLKESACSCHWGRSSASSEYSRQAKAAEEKARIERQYRAELWRNVSLAVKNPTLEDLRAVALNLWTNCWHDLRKAYMDTLGIEAPKGTGYNSNARDYEKPVSKLIAATKTSRELLVWLTAFTLFRDCFVQSYEQKDAKDELHQAAQRYGVDAAAIRREIDAEWREKRQKKAEKEKAKKAKTPASKAMKQAKTDQKAIASRTKAAK